MTEIKTRRRHKMTPLQEQQIRNYRTNGAGYQAIANVLGLERDTVRNYCAGRHLETSCAVIDLQKEIQNGTVCPNCGKWLDQPTIGRRRRFCSNDCRRVWWANHQEDLQKRSNAMYSFTCAFCGKPFLAYGDQHRKYCCHDCYIQDRFKKHEELS